jgi:vancomycin resistance protein YoaR
MTDELMNPTALDFPAAGTDAAGAVIGAPADAGVPVVDAPVTTPRPRRRARTLFAIAFVISLIAGLAIGAGALYAFDINYTGKVLPGVSVGGVDLSGATPAEASARLKQAFGRFSQGKAVLSGGGLEMAIDYSDVDRRPDIDRMVAEAMAVGRSGNTVERIIHDARTAVHGVNLAPLVLFDQTRLARYVQTYAARLKIEPKDAFVGPTKHGFAVTEGVEGRLADRLAPTDYLTLALADINAPPEIDVDLAVSPVEPAVTTDEATAAKATADAIAKDIAIVQGKEKWTVAAATVRSWISFQTGADGKYAPVVDPTALNEAVAAVAKSVEKKPSNASFRFSGGRITGVVAGKNGRALDVETTATRVADLLRARATGAADAPVAPAMTVLTPSLTTEQAKAFAPKMRPISSFSIYYWVIVNNHWGGNIEAPATKINGTVVPAGGIFDFWQVVGDLRKLPGAGPGNAIEGGKITVTGAFGGGICTTSTTLFNAAFRAGMVPMARQNHNEFINRYPPGLDATVWIVGGTKQTMSFKNDTQYPIMITRTITNDGSKRWITFKIWSVPNGRTYKISNLVIHHGPRAIDTVEHDRTKPVGYRFRNNAPADGAKVWVTVSIYDHGKLHWTKRYYSNYPAVNGVLVVGTKKS